MLNPVADLKFAQPARRNLLAPVLLAFLILGIVLALLLRFTPHRTADLTIVRTTIYPTHTVFKSDSIVIANQHAEDTLYVLTTLRIDDRLHLPLFLKDFTATLTTGDGEEVTTSAVEKPDLENVYTWLFGKFLPARKHELMRPYILHRFVSGLSDLARAVIEVQVPATLSIKPARAPGATGETSA